MNTRPTLTVMGHTNAVTSEAFSTDGRRIVTGSADNTIKLWDATRGRGTLTLKGYTDKVTSLAFGPDGGPPQRDAVAAPAVLNLVAVPGKQALATPVIKSASARAAGSASDSEKRSAEPYPEGHPFFMFR
jgi:WD40 repeat protein